MMKLLEIYKAFDIIVAPFPFADITAYKIRPMVVLSSHKHFNNKIKHYVAAMITSAEHEGWPLDIIIKDLQSSGLPKPSMVRLKLFTLDARLIKAKIGELSQQDRKNLEKNLSMLLSDIFVAH